MPFRTFSASAPTIEHVEEPGRGTARINVAGADFGSIDVGYANISMAHIGNRLLSRFLVSIDYRQHVIGLWRDPRIPLR